MLVADQQGKKKIILLYFYTGDLSEGGGRASRGEGGAEVSRITFIYFRALPLREISAVLHYPCSASFKKRKKKHFIFSFWGNTVNISKHRQLLLLKVTTFS